MARCMLPYMSLRGVGHAPGLWVGIPELLDERSHYVGMQHQADGQVARCSLGGADDAEVRQDSRTAELSDEQSPARCGGEIVRQELPLQPMAEVTPAALNSPGSGLVRKLALSRQQGIAA